MKTRYYTAILICIFISTLYSFGQNQVKNIKIPSDTAILNAAICNLYGINRPLNYDKAYRYLTILAKKNNPHALNTLGVMYSQGMGVKTDLNLATKFFYAAHRYGSNSGTCNLALAYHKGLGIKQDYKRAYELYDSLAQKGYAKGLYGAGEMLYKGYGVKQNYIKANSYFEKGAAKGDKNSLYMLGCASINGHGKEQDFDKGKEYFTKAMAKGHSWVEDIIDQGVIDSIQTVKSNKKLNIKDTLNYVSNKTKIDEIEGNWSGTFYTYDWSGKEIEKEVPLTIEITMQGDSAWINWIEDGVSKYQFMAYKMKYAWVVKHFKYSNSECVIKQVFEQLKFELTIKGEEKVLTGNILSVSPFTKDKMKPTSFKLSNGNSNSEAENVVNKSNISILKIYPNPFNSNLQLTIKLKMADNVRITICNTYGTLVYQQNAEFYTRGEHNIPINTCKLITGQYVMHVIGSNVVESAILFKL